MGDDLTRVLLADEAQRRFGGLQVLRKGPLNLQGLTRRERLQSLQRRQLVRLEVIRQRMSRHVIGNA